MDKSFQSDFSSDNSHGSDTRVDVEGRRQYGSGDESGRAWPPAAAAPEDDDYSGESSPSDEDDSRFWIDDPTVRGVSHGMVDDDGQDVVAEDELEEEGEVDVSFTCSENLKVEYVGRHRMAVVDKLVDDSFLDPDEPDAVSRLVVIDAANALHGWTPLFGGENLTLPRNEQRVDAAYILSLVRFFVSKGIECMVVAQHKYMLDKVVDNTFIMNTLKQLGLMMVMDATYDDLVLFTVAGEFDAVILSEDQFRDEQRDLKYFLTPNVKRALELRVSPIYPRAEQDFLKKEDWGKVSRNGHFVVDHLLRFDGSRDVLRKKFFSTAARGGHRHELVVEKNESWQRRREEVLKELDLLLARMQPIMEEARRVVQHMMPRGN